MRIAYCTNVRLPSERAHGHQIAHVCDALVRLGHSVTIFAPFRRNPVSTDYTTYYGARPEVKLCLLGSFDAINRWFLPGVLGLWVLNVLFRGNLRRELTTERFDVLYTRSPALLSSLLKTSIPVILELHQLPRRGRGGFISLCKRCAIVSCLTSVMRDELLAAGVPPNLVVAEGDAVDEAWLSTAFDREASRAKWEIEKERFVLGYAGSLSTFGLPKGADQIVHAVALLRHRGVPATALIAGGPPAAEAVLRETADALGVVSFIRFLGQLPRSDVPSVLAASDVLVYPAPASRHPYFLRDTSPLKIFEYMAASRPIVAADLPPLREILHDSMALFYTPGNVETLAAAVHSVQKDPSGAVRRAAAARTFVSGRTWTERMRRIFAAARLQS
ncbi:MAG: glycosyltransferase [Candidatus Peribacteraceae bacterium]